MTTYADLTHIQERLGSEASINDAQAVAKLAAELAEEQGDDAFVLLDWLQNRTYPWTELFEASQGNVAALVRVRAEAHLPPLDIAARPDADFPDGLTGESAYYAADGPRDQAIPELGRIEAVARAHGTEQSIALADEARTYLAWLADHESCADMPEDWEAE